MKQLEWFDDRHIEIEPPKRTKKITGTRFATVLGYDPWKTPFEIWCAVTKTYEKPFEDNIYTIAGKNIEPKQAEYLRGMGLSLISPTDAYGEDYFNKTHGDFFKEESKVFGGMWDFLGVDDETGEVDTVYEMKTTKRAEDWVDDIPEYYALQASLYAWLLGVDNVVMVSTFLADTDYNHPEQFVVDNTNTALHEFKVSERYPNFEQLVQFVHGWWNTHVLKGVSPTYDEKADAEILKAMRTTQLAPDTDISAVISEANSLRRHIESVEKSIADDIKRLKSLDSVIKEYLVQSMGDDKDKVEHTANGYEMTVSRGRRVSVDTDALKRDGYYDKYTTVNETFTYRVKENRGK